MEKESEEDYTVDAEVNRVEKKSLLEEMDPGHVGMMRRLKRVFNDCYLSRQHSGVCCDSLEADQKAKLKLSDVGLITLQNRIERQGPSHRLQTNLETDGQSLFHWNILKPDSFHLCFSVS